MTFLLAAMILTSIVLSVAVGAPTYFTIQKQRKVDLKDCVISGAFIGAISPALPFSFVLFSLSNHSSSVGDSDGHAYINGLVMVAQILYLAVLGASIGYFFWLIALRSFSKKGYGSEPNPRNKTLS